MLVTAGTAAAEVERSATDDGAEVEVEESNNRFLITFADSDMDMHTNKGHFVYGENY